MHSDQNLSFFQICESVNIREVEKDRRGEKQKAGGEVKRGCVLKVGQIDGENERIQTNLQALLFQ